LLCEKANVFVAMNTTKSINVFWLIVVYFLNETMSFLIEENSFTNPCFLPESFWLL